MEFADVNPRTPLESAWAEVYVVPYILTGNGKLIGDKQSSHELPMLAVPAVIVPAAAEVE